MAYQEKEPFKITIMQFLKNTDQSLEKLYDLTMVTKMCRGNQDHILKLVEVFITQISQSVEQIWVGYNERDLVRIENVIHKIKPTLTYFDTDKIKLELLLIEALVANELWTIELKEKIASLDAVVKRTVDKMEEDFCINNNNNNNNK